MLSVVIPIKNRFELVQEAIHNLRTYAKNPLDIIIVDNGSDPAFAMEGIRVIRNTDNIGFWPSMLQGIRASRNDLVLCMHNDVFVYGYGFDERIEREFANDPLLGIAGFFGGRGVAPNGGRGHPEGNMIARKYGTAQDQHGYWQQLSHPAVVFDSLAMVFDKKKLEEIDPKTIPPHHWTDRVVTLRMIQKGYRASTIGIAHDHISGGTGNSLSNFSQQWCIANNVAPVNDPSANMPEWDLALYRYGEKMFADTLEEIAGENTQLWVDHEYNYYTIKQGG